MFLKVYNNVTRGKKKRRKFFVIVMQAKQGVTVNNGLLSFFLFCIFPFGIDIVESACGWSRIIIIFYDYD